MIFAHKLDKDTVNPTERMSCYWEIAKWKILCNLENWKGEQTDGMCADDEDILRHEDNLNTSIMLERRR